MLGPERGRDLADDLAPLGGDGVDGGVPGVGLAKDLGVGVAGGAGLWYGQQREPSAPVVSSNDSALPLRSPTFKAAGATVAA